MRAGHESFATDSVAALLAAEAATHTLDMDDAEHDPRRRTSSKPLRPDNESDLLKAIRQSAVDAARAQGLSSFNTAVAGDEAVAAFTATCASDDESDMEQASRQSAVDAARAQGQSSSNTAVAGDAAVAMFPATGAGMWRSMPVWVKCDANGVPMYRQTADGDAVPVACHLDWHGHGRDWTPQDHYANTNCGQSCPCCRAEVI